MSIFSSFYTYRKTKSIEENIIKIEALKRVLDFLPKLPNLEESLRQRSLLKSSLFSAKIEGNKLKLLEVENIKEKTKNLEKKEVFNILSALKWIYSLKAHKRVDQKLMLKLHCYALKGISYNAGEFRKEPSAIFNQAGIAVYLTPPPSEVTQLISTLINYLNTSKDHPLIKTAIFHFAFEKIHPFLDGNGRVGRLLIVYLLKRSGYDFRGLVSLEEYLNNQKEEYYYFLALTKKNITSFVEFFLEAIAISAHNSISKLQDQKEEDAKDSLLPRRAEILEIIKDHQMVTFDFIKRRFYKIPSSSLHFDLKMLLKQGFIRKLGKTRGSLYKVKTT